MKKHMTRLGLAPRIVDQIVDIIRRINSEGIAVLFNEQNVHLSFSNAHRGYLLESGRIVLEGSADQLRENSDIKEFYLGLNEVGTRKSYRDVKHYKRRKRWL